MAQTKKSNTDDILVDPSLLPLAGPITLLADDFCPRQISFTIPGKAGVQVTATEDNGHIDFVVDVLGGGKHSGDLRGLFMHFNEAKLAGLQITGGDGWITGTQINANKVIDLGQGANMQGKADPFDIGIAFGTPGKGKDFLDGPIHFTLSDAANNLTLDDFAHLQFGARLTSSGDKITAIAPAAPDARDDTATTHEDTPVTIQVLANDTDADGDTLMVTSVHLESGAHGTVAIAADGHSIIYTPDEDYAGTNFDPNSIDVTFEYCVSDGHGGQDSANVNVHVIPVADLPTITFEVLAPEDSDPVNLVRLKVTATQSDADGSEFIDRIEFGGVPAGVTLTTDGSFNDPGQPDTVTEFVELTLPLHQDTNFNFSVTAYSQEEGNGDPDETSATASLPIVLDFNHNAINRTFAATDRSIWSDDEAIGFKDQDFLGVDKTFGDAPEFTLPVPIPATPLFVNATADVDGHFKFGFNYDIEINGGKINAQAPFDVSLDTTFNRTTDILQIDAQSAVLSGLSFQTEGPGGHFFLDAIADINLALDIALSLPVGPTLHIVPDAFDSVVASNTLRIIDISDHANVSIPLPAGFSISAAFPADVDASGTTGAPANTVTGSDNSDNFIDIDWNIGVAASQFVPIIAPLFNPIPVVVPPLVGTITPIIATIGVGADVVQTFDLAMQGMEFDVVLEDGTHYDLDPLLGVRIPNASSHDLDHDGLEFTLVMDPKAQLKNDTDIGVNFSWNLDLLRADLTVPLPVDDIIGVLEDIIDFIFGDDFDLPDSIDIHRPLVDLGQDDVPVTTIDVLEDQFALKFQSQDAMFVA